MEAPTSTGLTQPGMTPPTCDRQPAPRRRRAAGRRGLGVVVASVILGFSPVTVFADSGPWSVYPSGNADGRDNTLLGIACVAAIDCWAVGNYVDPSSVPRTLIEHWDGTSWSPANTSANDPRGSRGNFLNAVACVSSVDCWAVGQYRGSVDQTLAEHWDGTVWTVVASDDSGSSTNQLTGVSCVTVNDCWAVGWYYDGTAAQPLIERFSGGAGWSAVSTVGASTSDNVLVGISCSVTGTCWAAGNYYPSSSSHSQTLIERFDGTSWSVVPSGNQGAGDNFLNAVTCSSDNDCWGVGYFNDVTKATQPDQALTERWTGGSSWTALGGADASDNTAGNNNYLQSVVCLSASDCWAVGLYQQSGSFTARTLTDHYDGSVWSLVGSDNNGTKDNSLYGVTCVAAADCWAVGTYNNGTAAQTLVERNVLVPAVAVPEAPMTGAMLVIGGAVAVTAWGIRRRATGAERRYHHESEMEVRR